MVPEVSLFVPDQRSKRGAEGGLRLSEVDLSVQLRRQDDKIKELQDQIELLLTAAKRPNESSIRENVTEKSIPVAASAR